MISDPCVEFHIDAALLLAEGKVALAVHGEREHARVVRENLRGTFAQTQLKLKAGRQSEG